MSLGLLYDVHGNLPALEAVLQDARDVDSWLLGGDYALFGAWPRETVARLRELDARWIRGNGERWTATPSAAPEVEDPGVVYCHGSPISDVESFFPEPGARDEALMGRVASGRLVFGHTHLPFARVGPHGVELVNPGSAGMPLDGDPRAAYAVVRDHGRVEQRRVAYDHQASADAIRARLGAAGEQAAGRVERASFDA